MTDINTSAIPARVVDPSVTSGAVPVKLVTDNSVSGAMPIRITTDPNVPSGAMLIYYTNGNFRILVRDVGGSVVTPPATITAPTLTQTSTAGTNPMAFSVQLPDATVRLPDDALIVQRAADSGFTTSLATETHYFTEAELSSTDGTLSAQLALLSAMPAGATNIRARWGRGPKANVVVFEGDSMTASDMPNYALTLLPSGGNGVTFIKNAYSGRRVDNAPGNGVVQAIDETVRWNPSIVHLLIGANDLNDTVQWGVDNTAAAANYIAAILAHINVLKARIPGVKVVLSTILPQATPNATNNTNHNARRAIVNAQYRVWAGNGTIDGVADYDTDARLGATDAAAANTTYYATDGIHPVNAYHFMSAIVEPVIAALLPGGVPVLTSPWSNTISDTISSGVASTTFDPSIKSPYAALSNGNLSLAGTAGVGAPSPVRVSASRNSGDLYAEFTVTGYTSQISIGVCNANFDPFSADKFNAHHTAFTASAEARYFVDTAGTANDLAFDDSSAYRGYTPGFGTSTTDKTQASIIGIRMQFSTGKMLVYYDGTLMTTRDMPTPVTGGQLWLYASCNAATDTLNLNCGQTAFVNQPSGTTMYG